jgi:haloacid dehalogenase superfamily, subfamily IA, variant 3 with third motif having DD or ED
LINNIVFDMGNVLIDYQPMEYVRKHVTGREDAQTVLNAMFGAPDWPENDRGTVTYEQFLERVKARIPDRLYPAAKQLWESWITYLKPIPETNRLARELKQKGFRLYLLSNVSIRYCEFRRTISAIDCFDGEFISADVHFIKPETEIYRLFFSRFGLTPQECFFIDDNAENIAAARRLGMDGFRFQQDVRELRQALKEAGVLSEADL